MKKLFSREHSLEALAALFALGAALGVLQTFIIGKHFVIPTMVLLLVIYFGNLARFGTPNREPQGSDDAQSDHQPIRGHSNRADVQRGHRRTRN